MNVNLRIRKVLCFLLVLTMVLPFVPMVGFAADDTPVLNGITISAASVNAPGEFEVVLDVTENASGLAYGWVDFYCQETGKTLFAYLEPGYYDPVTYEYIPYEDGKLHGILAVDQYVQSGRFTVFSVELYDSAENNYYYSYDSDYGFPLPESFQNLYFDVTESDTPDGIPPVLKGVTLSKTSVSAPGQVEVIVEATDNLSGIYGAEMLFYCEETEEYLYAYTEAGYYNEDTYEYILYEDGKLHGILEIDENVEDGRFHIDEVIVWDIAINYAGYLRDTLPNAVKALELTVTNSASELPDHQHQYESVITDPTCEDGGYTTHTCACGEIFVDSYTDALGHDWDESQCLRCGKTQMVSSIYYGRNQLAQMADGEKYLWAYDRIVEGVENTEDQIDLNGGAGNLTTSEFKMVMDAYMRDHTGHFWMGNSYSYSISGGNVVLVKPDYYMTGNALEKARADFNAAVEEILSGIRSSMSDYEKELYLHDALAARVYYDEPANAHNAYGALVNGVAVCEGYAEALQYLLQQVGIQSFIITGSSRGEGHAWNAVNIDGKFYHVDLTWNDQGETLYHAYFNVTDARIQEDHTIDTAEYPLPVCNSEDAFYFTGKDTLMTTYTANSVGALLKANNGKVHVYVPSGDVDTFIDWYFSNIVDIATAAGVNGGFSYGYSSMGREVVLEIPELQSHTHAYEAVITPPTCTERGYTAYVCECGDYYIDSYTDPLGHDWGDGEMLHEPTVTDEGLKIYTCAHCKEVKYEHLPKVEHEHIYESKITPPTCIDKGYTTHICTLCGNGYEDSYTDPLNHVWDEGVVTQEPTEEEFGSMIVTCTRCGYSTPEPVPPLGHTHTFETLIHPPTCENRGHTTYSCTSCGFTFSDDDTDPLGHDWDEGVVTKEPTRKTEGIRTYTCARCGSIKTESIPKLENIDAGCVGGLGHSFQSGTHYKSPTATADGAIYTDCAVCGQQITIPVGNEIHAPEGSPFLDWEWEVLLIANSIRVHAGLDPLTGFDLLQQATDIRANEISYYFDHYRPDGTDCFTVLSELGIAAYAAGENIAGGQYSPIDVMNDWMNSAGHRANILQESFQQMGVGYYQGGYYGRNWVQMFLGGGNYTGFRLVVPENTTYETGTMIDEMGIYALLTHSLQGDVYLPIQSMYCTGYNPNQEGTQTITVSVLGYTGTFTITVGEEDPCANGHDLGPWEVTKEATCTETGMERRDCANCDYNETRELDKIPHSYTDKVTDPTCTDKGHTTHTCACGDSYVDSYIDALGHDWNDGVVTKEATEETEGVRTYTCTRCGETKTESIPKLDHVHKYTDKVTAPTCTDKGFTTHTCACGDSFVDTYTNALGHAWDGGVVTKEATEEAEGILTYTCTRCGETKTESIPKLDHKHKYTDVVTQPTCTDKGYTTHTCACGDSYVDSYIDALGHDWDKGVVTKEATEEAEGILTYTCTRCGETKTESIPKLDHKHKYTDVVTQPTCTERGYTTYICRCGDSYVDSYTEPTGHSFGDWEVTKEPTDTEKGIETRTCACGEEETREIEAAVEYKFGDVNGDGVVDSDDAALICYYDAELIPATDLLLRVGDVTGDGFVNSDDAALICYMDAEIIEYSDFPCFKKKST